MSALGQPDREAQWALATRALAFFAGLALIYHEAVVQTEPRLPLLIVAVGMLGPVIANTVATLVESVRGLPGAPPPAPPAPPATPPANRDGVGGGEA